MNISIVAPSYRRPKDVITTRYIPFLKLYVHPAEEEEYRQNNRCEIVACADGIQGNIARVRNYIWRKELNELGNDVVVIVDDDMSYLGYFEKGLPKILATDDILPMIEKYTILAEEWGAKLWGMNVNPDRQAYREYTPFSTVSYCGSPFTAILKGNEVSYDESLPFKEDYDFTLQHCNRYRIALRINHFFYVVKQSEQPGGCAVHRNIDAEERQFNLLQKKWGKDIVQRDVSDRSHKSKADRVRRDYNPVIHIPIKGV